MANSSSYCSCVEASTKSREKVQAMTRVSLESILEVCEEFDTASRQWSACASHSTTSVAHIWESQLQMCQKLITLLEAATALYRLSDAPLQRNPPPGPVQDAMQCGPGQETTEAEGVICLHSTMSLGRYELQDRESRYLGLSLVCTMVDKLAAVLQQMARQGCQAQDIWQTDARILMLLSRSKRSKDTASAAMYSLSMLS